MPLNLPAAGPTTPELVKGWLSIDDDVDDTEIGKAVAAVNQLVRRMPVCQLVAAPEGEDPPAGWPDDVELGATMLAARVARRRATPGGVEAAGAFGIAYVRRNDPDVAQLLRLGEYGAPAVG